MSRDYDVCHPDYDGNRIRTYSDIYTGLARPEVVRAYLYRNDSESNESYRARIRRAAYINLAAPVADLFAAVAAGSVNRSGLSGIAALEPMQHNCDRGGNSPDAFFKRVCAKASPLGAHFVLVDMKQAETPAGNQDEARKMGLIPHFVHVPAQSLYAWDFDSDGSLAYIVRRGTRQVSSGPFTGFGEVQTREVWTKTGWQRLEARPGASGVPGGPGSSGASGVHGSSGASGSGGDLAGFVVVAEGEHPCGQVPIVPFLFEEDNDSPMVGLSVFDDVAENIIQLFNIWSELDKSLADASLPWLWLKGVNPEDALKMVRSSDSAIATSNADADGKYLEASGASFAAKQAQIEAAVKYITNVSLRRTRPDSASAVSADARREDNRELVALMKDFAARMQEGERRCWQLAGKWLGLDDEALAAMRVSYEVQYDEDDISGGTIGTLIELAKNKVFSAEFVGSLVHRTNFIQDMLAPEEKRVPYDAALMRAAIDAEAGSAD